ncbi:MAG: multiheme c-type cytochrome, partial [Candidatus Poribacteria bacterium]|nr:multiheme c-type cytochrome [Candidatus Poribacteria bacterium]
TFFSPLRILCSMNRLAWLASIFVMFLGVALGVIAQKSMPSANEMRAHLNEGKCADCHPDVWKEWEKSGPAQAWTSELYQSIRKQYDHANDCDHCHSPKPLHMTGIGELPQLRDDNRERGVDCLTCHLGADGAMRGPHADSSPFHKTIREPVLYTRQTTLCASCHGQPKVMAHNQVKEFAESGLPRQGETCQKCHMPEVTRKPSRFSRSAKPSGRHTWEGSRSQARLENTFLLDYLDDDTAVTVLLTNGAGHAVPAAPLREAQIGLLVVGANGSVLYSKVERHRHPLNVDSKPLEPKIEDTRLKVGETREYVIPLTRSARRGAELTASVLYRRSTGAEWTQMAALKQRF